MQPNSGKQILHCTDSKSKLGREHFDFHAKYNQLVKHVGHQKKGKNIFYTKYSYSRTKGDYQEETCNALIKACLLHNFILQVLDGIKLRGGTLRQWGQKISYKDTLKLVLKLWACQGLLRDGRNSYTLCAQIRQNWGTFIWRNIL